MAKGIIAIVRVETVLRSVKTSMVLIAKVGYLSQSYVRLNACFPYDLQEHMCLQGLTSVNVSRWIFRTGGILDF